MLCNLYASICNRCRESKLAQAPVSVVERGNDNHHLTNTWLKRSACLQPRGSPSDKTGLT